MNDMAFGSDTSNGEATTQPARTHFQPRVPHQAAATRSSLSVPFQASRGRWRRRPRGGWPTSRPKSDSGCCGSKARSRRNSCCRPGRWPTWPARREPAVARHRPQLRPSSRETNARNHSGRGRASESTNARYFTRWEMCSRGNRRLWTFWPLSVARPATTTRAGTQACADIARRIAAYAGSSVLSTMNVTS